MSENIKQLISPEAVANWREGRKRFHENKRRKPIKEENKKLLEPKGYEFKLWTDAEILELIKTEYPSVLKVFEATQTGVKKGEIARMIFLYHQGGI